MKIKLLTILGIIFLSGCQFLKDPVSPEVEVIPPAKGVYILNEGNFGKGNSRLSYYVVDSNKVYNDIFSSANSGNNLGDTGNDVKIFGDKAFIVVNNSHKIYVIQTLTHKLVGTLLFQGSKSPFKLAVVNSSKAYVTNLYDNSVTVFNPTTLQIIKERISVGKNPQSLVNFENKIYVCNSGWGSDSTVSVIDITKDSVVKTINVGVQPSGIGIDSDGEIIVKYDGVMNFSDQTKDTPGGFTIIDPIKDEVKTNISLSLAIYGHGEKFFVTNNGFALLQTKIGIVKFETNLNAIGTSAFINSSEFSVNGINFDEANKLVYVSDAKDYTNAGEIHIFNNDGTKKGSFKADIIPGAVAFVR